jgi:hypothetical protein
MRQTAPRVDVVGFLQETRQEIQLSINHRHLVFSAIFASEKEFIVTPRWECNHDGCRPRRS